MSPYPIVEGSQIHFYYCRFNSYFFDMRSSTVSKFVLLGLSLSILSTWATPVPVQESSHSSRYRGGKISDKLSDRDKVIVNEAMDVLTSPVPNLIRKAPGVEGQVEGNYVVSILQDANGKELGRIGIQRSMDPAKIEFEYHELDEEKGTSKCILSIGHTVS
ncbi:hypothetical protein C8R42DRAFT_728635 [Lentinula raphanica]|nr:hypothetical protein C8R42DRAFT_728635 [Lentinula raphanica]